MDRHLDSLDLDAARAGEATPEARVHLEACAACRAEVEKLAAFAARLRGPAIEVPAALDRAILARPRRRRAPYAAAGAALLIAAATWLLWPEPPRAPDMVDAYRLALRLEAGETVETTWDLNGDGRVDMDDVRALAARTVRLDR